MALLASKHSRGGFRPTRRDLILVLLTFATAYLVLAAPAAADRARAASGSGRGRFNSLTDLFSGKNAAEICNNMSGNGQGSLLFDESVKKVGFVRNKEKPAGDEEADDFADRITGLQGFSPGWSLWEKLYLFNGQLYVITDKRSDFPELRLLTSTGVGAVDEPGNAEAREPKGDEIIFRTPEEAYELWGDNVYRMRGMTYIWNDGNFIDHYYHFAAELLIGTWRVHASLDPNITPEGHSVLEPPTRAWFLHHDHQKWRDGPRFNPTILYGLFPNIATLFPEDMSDLKTVTTSEYRKKAFVFDRAILADRSAAFRGPFTGSTSRTFAGACQVNNVSRWWWEPIRRQMLRFSDVSEDIINRSLEGYGAVDPIISEKLGKTELEAEFKPLKPSGDYKPVVTYISRQKSRRRLLPGDHAALVKALEAKAKKLNFELIVVEAERYTKEEQFAIAGKTTIMLGVHGNGLSHLLWMPPTPRSAVIEMFFKGGFARDYQWTAHALGIRHYAVQHDKIATSPNEFKVDYPDGDGPDDGFQGTKITVDAQRVADLIEARLTGAEVPNLHVKTD